MEIFLNRLDAGAMFTTQQFQNQEALYLSDTVPAGGQQMGSVAVSSYGHFYSLYITGSFQVCADLGAGTVDTGMDYLRGRLIDAATQRTLFNDYVPFSLFCSPGPRKSVAAGVFVSGNFVQPLPWEYLWTVNSTIQMDVRNVSNVPVSYSLLFVGVRIKTPETVQM
jgi:hypothetical protein